MLQARNGVGGDVLLRPGAVVNGFQIVRSEEPGADRYVARFTYQSQTLASALYAFLPRTRILEDATDTQ